MNYNSKIIIACDVNSRNELVTLIAKFDNKKLFLKLGMQLLYSEGFGLISELRSLGHQIFIDLKLHDIPNTAKQGVKSLLKYEPDFLTVHTSGGLEMLKAVKELETEKTKIIGVTVLTSLNQKDLDSLNIKTDVKSQVETLIKLAKEAGLSHIVCSPHEVELVKKHNMIAITPGIRPAESEANDQERIMTPKEAFAKGADFIVVGRPITKAANPKDAYESIERESNESSC